MNLPATVGLPRESALPAMFRDVFLAAFRSITWKTIAITFAIVAAMDLWWIMEVITESSPKLPPGEAYLSGTIINLIMAFSIMFSTRVADEIVAHGAGRWSAYAGALAFGCAVAALAQWQVHRWLHLRTGSDLPEMPHDMVVMQPLKVFFEYLLWGAVIVFVYANRRMALLAAARMVAAREERARIQRRTLESQLQALQARVEPQFLFNTLGKVRDLYESDVAKGGQMLDDLIVYLRAALPHLRDSTSPLERELTLVHAYLGILRIGMDVRLTSGVEVPLVALAAHIPSMILLPLAQHLVGRVRVMGAIAETTIRVGAWVDRRELRVELRIHGESLVTEGPDAALRDIRERLSGLYGDRATLCYESGESGVNGFVLSIPYEAPDSDPR